MIFGIILGIILGCSIGFFIVMNGVKNSNDLGDSKASYIDFSASTNLKIIVKADKISRKEYTPIVKMTLPPHA